MGLVTASPAIAADYACAEILRITGARRTSKPNKRDGVVNLMVASDPAAALARWLYKDARIALERKHAAALAVASWTRPHGMRARSAPETLDSRRGRHGPAHASKGSRAPAWSHCAER